MDAEAVERLERIEKAIEADGRYPLDAYEFLNRGLQFATRETYGDQPALPGQARHVSGRQLCLALRDLSLQTWGPLAHTVLRNWSIRRTRDFGEMVFFLIRLELMGAQPSDRVEDFDNVYDFDEAFGRYEVQGMTGSDPAAG